MVHGPCYASNTHGSGDLRVMFYCAPLNGKRCSPLSVGWLLHAPRKVLLHGHAVLMDGKRWGRWRRRMQQDLLSGRRLKGRRIHHFEPGPLGLLRLQVRGVMGGWRRCLHWYRRRRTV